MEVMNLIAKADKKNKRGLFGEIKYGGGEQSPEPNEKDGASKKASDEESGKDKKSKKDKKRRQSQQSVSKKAAFAEEEKTELQRTSTHGAVKKQ